KRGALPALHFVARRPDPFGAGDIRVGLGALVGARVLVVAVGGKLRGIGDIASAAEVPFAEVASGVTGGLQDARETGRGGIEKIGLVTSPIAGASLEVARDAPACGKLAGDETTARRGADGRSAVVLREAEAFAGEAVEVGRGDIGAAIAADVATAKVI